MTTAEDVCSYKPCLDRFLRCLTCFGDRESTIHVAQSLFHDGCPAGELDLAFVWINRYKHSNDIGAAMAAEFNTRLEFADAVCG